MLRRRSFPIPFVVALAAFFVQTPAAKADVKLPGFFGDSMVVQQEMPVRVWGTAEPGESVQVTLEKSRKKTSQAVVADESGKWRVELPAQQASHDAHKMIVQGNNTIEINDVLIGEVWLCSGQSNMEWAVRSCSDAKAEIAAANYPLIRHIKIGRNPSTSPREDLDASWAKCNPQTAGSFTAVGYFMARKLREQLDVPIGLINSSWGGTRVEPWTPPVGFKNVEALADIYTSVLGRTPGSASYQATLSKHIDATQQWLSSAKTALDSGIAAASSPGYPPQLIPFKSHQDPTMLYNGMIHPLVGYPIRGAIWYQGESNHNEGMLYFEKKKALINGWRSLWGQGDFPFYFVQIAPYQYGKESTSILAEFWEAQAAVQQLPNTGMVVINDVATLNDIHPPNKRPVGERLADFALKNDYGRADVVAGSPELESINVTSDALKLTFRNVAGGLKTRDGKPATHFEVIGSGSGGFQSATARIDGDSVILTSDQVASPSAFRFAWHKLAEPNLIGGSGWPVGACRGGKVPKFIDNVPELGGFDLVYELDLGKLGPEIVYSIDNSGSVGDFDQIAYHVALESSALGIQNVFVVVDAFTDDVKKIGVPSASSGAKFQQKLTNMHVFSDVTALHTGEKAVDGWIEFWPHNYGPQNGAAVPNASQNKYDFGDTPSQPVNGHGSMQIHYPADRETIFAINSWRHGASADLGIGNHKGEHPDWTFADNASQYSRKTLQVYVRMK